MAYSRYDLEDDLFGAAEALRREKAMEETINEIEQALMVLKSPSPWSDDIKASDDFLDPVFQNYFSKLELPNIMRKTDYHILVSLVDVQDIDHEIVEKLDKIYEVAQKANPVSN